MDSPASSRNGMYLFDVMICVADVPTAPQGLDTLAAAAVANRQCKYAFITNDVR